MPPTATTDGDVTEGTAFGPVATTAFAEVARLGEAVIVVITKLSVGRATSWTIG